MQEGILYIFISELGRTTIPFHSSYRYIPKCASAFLIHIMVFSSYVFISIGFL